MDVLLLKVLFEKSRIDFLPPESMKDPKKLSSLVLLSSFCEDENMLSLPPAALLLRLRVKTEFSPPPQPSDKLQLPRSILFLLKEDLNWRVSQSSLSDVDSILCHEIDFPKTTGENKLQSSSSVLDDAAVV